MAATILRKESARFIKSGGNVNDKKSAATRDSEKRLKNFNTGRRGSPELRLFRRPIGF